SVASPPATVTPAAPRPPRVGLVTGSAAAALRRLCTIPPSHVRKAPPAGHVPAIVTRTEHEVEAVRGLRYRHPVAVKAVTHAQLVHGIDRDFERSMPRGLAARESLA